MSRVSDLVLLHGWGSAAAVWDDLARRLAPRFRVHALPLPGYDGAPAAASLRAAVASVSAAAPRRCGVVGWSLGGELALAWARLAPRQVRRLALVGTTPSFMRRPGWPCATAPAVLAAFGGRLADDRAGTLARFAGLQAMGDSRARRVVGELQRIDVGRTPTDVLAAGLVILGDADLRGTLRHIAQPALVLHGARDRVVPAAAGRRLAGTLPRSRFELLRACAHAPFLSQPARVARLLRGFFDE